MNRPQRRSNEPGKAPLREQAEGRMPLSAVRTLRFADFTESRL